MSRARPVTLPDGSEYWFDMGTVKDQARADDLELLASFEDVEIDDLLDESLTRGDVLRRLREHLGVGNIPAEVEMRRRAARFERQRQPECRICQKTGDSTKHHFVNKWILKELSNYEQVGARSRCCVPVCIDCHRDLHDRSTDTVSIVPYLEPHERQFARDVLEQLRREHPKILDLLAEGDYSVYEARLVKDWLEGRFDK